MFNYRKASRIVIVSTILLILTAITVTATQGTQFAFLDSVREFFGMASTATPTRMIVRIQSLGHFAAESRRAATKVVAQPTKSLHGLESLYTATKVSAQPIKELRSRENHRTGTKVVAQSGKSLHSPNTGFC